MNCSHPVLEEVQELQAEVRGTRKLEDIERAKELVNGETEHSGVILLVCNESGVIFSLIA